MEKDNKKTYTAPALSKGLDILELLAAEVDGLSLSEICEKLGRSASEIFRMLHVLAERGYVSQLPHSEKYCITLKMLQISFQKPRLKRLTAVASPVMRALSHAILQSCHLVIYYSGRGVVVAQQDSPAISGFSVRLGAEVPIVNTCSGHLLLSFADKKEALKMIKNQPRMFKVPMPPKDLEVLSVRVRKQGYEHMPSSLTLGIEDVGFPVYDHAGVMTAALVVPFLPHLDHGQKLLSSEIIENVRCAAAEISDALGYVETASI